MVTVAELAVQRLQRAVWDLTFDATAHAHRPCPSLLSRARARLFGSIGKHAEMQRR